VPAGHRGHGIAAVLRSQTVLIVDSLAGVKSHVGLRAVNSLAGSPPAGPRGARRGTPWSAGTGHLLDPGPPRLCL